MINPNYAYSDLFQRGKLWEKRGEIRDDPMVELRNLQETEGIGNYHNQFEAIRLRINLPESDLVSMYLDGLRSEYANEC